MSDLMVRPFDWHLVAPLYAQPHRVYHDIRHIHMLLDHIRQLGCSEDEKMWLEAVAWVHDAYYDPLVSAPINETRSAQLLHTGLRESFTPKGQSLAYDAVLATGSHHQDRQQLDPLIAQFLDLDLSNLAGSFSDFIEHTRRFSEEQLRAGKTQQDVLNGLSVWANAMLARTRLYYSSAFEDHEAQARTNLQQLVSRPVLGLPC